MTLVKIAEKAGIHYFFTGKEGMSEEGSHFIKRLDIGLQSIDTSRMLHILAQYDVNKRPPLFHLMENEILRVGYHVKQIFS